MLTVAAEQKFPSRDRQGAEIPESHCFPSRDRQGAEISERADGENRYTMCCQNT